MAPAAALAAFFLIVVPAIGIAVVWAVVTAWRILLPERPPAFLPDPVRERRRRTAGGEAVPVGFREIHEEMPLHARRVTHPYRMDRQRALAGLPGHVPEPWIDDLRHRRN
jgi:hypothetical protein